MPITYLELERILNNLRSEFEKDIKRIDGSSNERHKENTDKFDRLDNRMLAMERLVWKIIGFTSAFTLLGEFIIQLILKK